MKLRMKRLDHITDCVAMPQKGSSTHSLRSLKPFVSKLDNVLLSQHAALEEIRKMKQKVRQMESKDPSFDDCADLSSSSLRSCDGKMPDPCSSTSDDAETLVKAVEKKTIYTSQHEKEYVSLLNSGRSFAG